MRNEDKILKAMKSFMEENAKEGMDLEEMNALAQQFMAEYNDQIRLNHANGSEEIPVCADDFLELAETAGSVKKKREYLNRALELEPGNLDALHDLAELDCKDPNELLERLRALLKKADSQMKRKGFFRECMGDFWLAVETRPYMRLRHHYFFVLLNCGMMRAAASEGEEMLKLCTNDNLGVRFVLMHIYAYLEDEPSALALLKRYGEYDATQLMLPMAMLYFKAGKLDAALGYLKRLAAGNKDTKKFLSAMCSGNTDKIDACFDEMSPYGYRPGTMEEFLVELNDNDFLFVNADAFFLWARTALKPKKQSGGTKKKSEK
ncbi:MAG: hypothetical protein IK082_10035 [Oscillospiraceae bacterium]|nr:hypothetical protein [Oscillospiraceae bacterium]